MKNFITYFFLSLLVCGLIRNDIQADRGGRYAAAGLGGFAAGTFLGAALASRPVYYDDSYYYDDYGPYDPYWGYPQYRYGYRPEYRHDYYTSADGAPYRPKN